MIFGETKTASLRGRNFVAGSVRFFVGLLNFVLGFRRIDSRQNSEEVYRKYLGPDYKFTYDEGYSLIISNHTGWVDILMYMNKYACGFISKQEVATFPLIGIIAKEIGCLFVSRENSENRHLIVIYYLT